MIEAIRIIAERRIDEAIREGTLDVASWRNRPLPLTNDHLVPEELRMAHKILRNAGYLPPEIETRKEIQQVEELLAGCEDEYTRVRQLKKLSYLLMKLHAIKGESVNIERQDEYYRRIVERISVNRKSPK